MFCEYLKKYFRQNLGSLGRIGFCFNHAYFSDSVFPVYLFSERA